ncbi:MAG: ATP-binding cassette domain-containing protein [Alphaproteobacteria bacterium]|nr:ATP-binding cassette domain-containing protein [Alphaproteobacteria bacterium]
MFELREISKAYGAVNAITDLDLTITPGKTTALIGPSGCGKSTILGMMIELVQPDRGEIQFKGTALAPGKLEQLRQRMGYVIQDGGLFPHLSARHNVTLMADHLGHDPQITDQRVEYLCDLTHFPTDALGRSPAQLSGGQCQRVALMRALMLDPDVLLLDEPLGALDPLIRFELQTELRDIFQTLGKTVIMVTHDIGEASYFGDTIILLREGCIVQSGTIDDLTNRPADEFVERFVRAQRTIPGQEHGK